MWARRRCGYPLLPIGAAGRYEAHDDKTRHEWRLPGPHDAHDQAHPPCPHLPTSTPARRAPHLVVRVKVYLNGAYYLREGRC